jgi:hypothetical protein
MTSGLYFLPFSIAASISFCKSEIDYLTINEEHRLRRKVQELTGSTDKLELLHNEIQEIRDKLGL